jgi:hypothetical protein
MSLEEKRINITSYIIYLSRMVRKVRKDKRMAKRNGKNQEISLQTIESAESVRRLIHSLNLPLEEKVAMEDQINELSHKSNCLLAIETIGRSYFLHTEISWNAILMLLTRESMSYRIKGLNASMY